MNDGTQEWYQNNKLNRNNNLPAVIKANGDVEYWINDKKQKEILIEESKNTTFNCMIYFDKIDIGTKYRICSFSEEHVFTLDGLDNFKNDKCLYCQNDLINKIFIQTE